MIKPIKSVIFPYFYPRPPRGGRHALAGFRQILFHISIHALRGEGDAADQVAVPPDILFLSTPSAGRATHENGLRTFSWPHISIHALRGEGDLLPI